MGKVKRLQKRMIENINSTYRIFLLLFFALFAVFLTSKLWLPSDVPVQNTVPGTSLQTSESVAVSLRSWQYNPDRHFMEAAFSYQVPDSGRSIPFVLTAHTDADKAKPLDTSIPYNNNGLLMVQIQNVPQNWNVISLWIDSRQRQLTDLTKTDSSVSSDAGSTSGIIQQGADFFCDARKIVRNQSLKPQPSLFYSLKSIDNEIARVQSQIAQNNKKITAANLSIRQLNADITALEGNQKYQTADEVVQSKDVIQGKKTQIGGLKNSIAQAEDDIKNEEEKVQKLRQKWNDTRNGTYKGAGSDSAESVPDSRPSSSEKTEQASSQNVTVD